jgi:hypothetical protein
MANNNNFSYTFNTSKSNDEVFSLFLNVDQWWSGLFNEKIQGKSEKIDDEFSFSAGDGVHFSNQKLIELIPNQKIVWLVTDSNLSFLSQTDEWNNTKISIELETIDNQTMVKFTHQGLLPEIECYDACSSAWSQYLDNLEKKLN